MNNIEEIPLRAQVGRWLTQGWDWFVEDPAKYLVLGLVGTALLIVTQSLLLGPVMLGMAAVGVRRARHSKVEIGDFFEALPYFLPSLLSGILILGFSLIGLAVLIVPGIVIFSMYLFSFHFILDQGQDFGGAMESSRKLVARDYLGFSLFGGAVVLMNLLGLAFLVLGMMVTLPVTSLAISAAYFHCLDTEEASPPPSEATPVRID